MCKSWQKERYGWLQQFVNKLLKYTEVILKMWTSCGKTETKEENRKNNCYKNVIIFKKGVAFCKQVCYNTVTYIRNKRSKKL